MIEISNDKYSDLAENTEKALRYMGKVMQCIDDMNENGSQTQERVGMRGGYDRGNLGGRDRREWDEMGERRDYRGRYSRY